MSNRELIDKLRRNPRGLVFELEHECADALEKAEAELAAIKAALIEFHAAYKACELIIGAIDALKLPEEP